MCRLAEPHSDGFPATTGHQAVCILRRETSTVHSGLMGDIERDRDMGGLLWIVFVVIVGIWLLGLVLDVAGGFIHLLLIVAVIVLVYNLLTGRRNP